MLQGQSAGNCRLKKGQNVKTLIKMWKKKTLKHFELRKASVWQEI